MALALLLWLPQGVSHQPLVTGHSTFYDGDTFSPCLASIAGIIRHRVMWFNDQVLVETYGGAGTYIYVTEHGAPDPRKEKELYSEGVFYDFVDPNGAHWHIEEYFYDIVDETTIRRNMSGTIPSVEVSMASERTMVWVVEVAPRPIFDEFAGADPHTYYNFLLLVDTCKMHSNNIESFDGIENHDEGSGTLNDRYGHRNGEAPHTHERYMADIWVGKRPLNVIPYGASTTGAEWQTQWAHQSADRGAQQSSPDVGGLAP
ncbi:MAG TPA: hypothetical protein VM582_05245 [Candidatus Thermoplasmatota archaeon]|nr:hypothetical protein [Candidatus Thermoplasmatota archaeon]